MINKYEERLGTERMLPLVFKMALPAVAAQFVNLLYSMVDRIYIGHIPGIGTDALAGVGVTTSLVILISSFSAIVGGGGAPLAAIALGQGDRSRAGKILGNGFILLILFTLFTSLIAYTFMEPILLFTGASENTLEYAVNYLSIYLFIRNYLRRNIHRIKFFYQCTRASCYRHVLGINRSTVEYRPRPDFHFLARYGSKRCSSGYSAFTGM